MVAQMKALGPSLDEIWISKENSILDVALCLGSLRRIFSAAYTLVRFINDGVLISIESCCNTLSQEYVRPRLIPNARYLPFKS